MPKGAFSKSLISKLARQKKPVFTGFTFFLKCLLKVGRNAEAKPVCPFCRVSK